MAENALLFCLIVKLALVALIPSAEFKGMFGLKRGNKGQLTWRQKNNVFSATLE